MSAAKINSTILQPCDQKEDNETALEEKEEEAKGKGEKNRNRCRN